MLQPLPPRHPPVFPPISTSFPPPPSPDTYIPNKQLVAEFAAAHKNTLFDHGGIICGDLSKQKMEVLESILVKVHEEMYWGKFQPCFAKAYATLLQYLCYKKSVCALARDKTNSNSLYAAFQAGERHYSPMYLARLQVAQYQTEKNLTYLNGAIAFYKECIEKSENFVALQEYFALMVMYMPYQRETILYLQNLLIKNGKDLGLEPANPDKGVCNPPKHFVFPTMKQFEQFAQFFADQVAIYHNLSEQSPPFLPSKDSANKMEYTFGRTKSLARKPAYGEFLHELARFGLNTFKLRASILFKKIADDSKNPIPELYVARAQFCIQNGKVAKSIEYQLRLIAQCKLPTNPALKQAFVQQYYPDLKTTALMYDDAAPALSHQLRHLENVEVVELPDDEKADGDGPFEKRVEPPIA